MRTPLNPQEIYLLERYSSLKYFEQMRDAWAAMVKAGDEALAAFMRHLLPDYRSRPLHQQPDATWGEVVLPNLRWTLKGLDNGYIRLTKGGWDALDIAGNVLTAHAGMWRDYMNDWMAEPFRSIFDEQNTEAIVRAGNIAATARANWCVGNLTTRYSESRGPLLPPPSWPVYRLDPQVRVRTDEKVQRSGIYLPDASDSAAQVLIRDYEARKANIGGDPKTTQRLRTESTTWTLVERVADSGGGVPGEAVPAETL